MESNEERLPSVPVTPDVPARRGFTTPELEAVIRRALELQAGHSTGTDDVAAADVVRIGQELGLEPAAVRRAMAEVRTRPVEQRGALDSFVGVATVRATRVIPRPADTVARTLDQHLRDAELMVPQRRFGERTRYVQDSSFAAGISRFARGFSRAHPPLGLRQLEVAVSALDAESALVEVSVDLGTSRAGLVAGVFGSSTAAAAGWATVAWASALADPLMLLGIPVMGGAWLGTRVIYRSMSRSTGEKLESLLDRLEHNEL